MGTQRTIRSQCASLHIDPFIMTASQHITRDVDDTKRVSMSTGSIHYLPRQIYIISLPAACISVDHTTVRQINFYAASIADRDTSSISRSRIFTDQDIFKVQLSKRKIFRNTFPDPAVHIDTAAAIIAA